MRLRRHHGPIAAGGTLLVFAAVALSWFTLRQRPWRVGGGLPGTGWPHGLDDIAVIAVVASAVSLLTVV